ncbi:MAG: AAA family ATPase [Lachnospiraceae bacterium]|nr:AAA family ATPase [Lachnospiraceae bacterium]
MADNNMKKKLPIGIDDFRKIRTEGFYYVDKTTMIRDLLNAWGEVNLFTRPRRFGKSLNMSMLKAFLEIGCDKSLFEDLEISKETQLCEKYMGQFPVIFISLKTVHGSNYEFAKNELCTVIAKEALRFQFILTSEKLTDRDKKLYNQLVRADDSLKGTFAMSESTITSSLNTLSMLLEKYYGSKVIILIDEYDVPLAKANERKYYDEMIDLIRNMLDASLKSNQSLYFAVMTGCLRVSKESIFTGLNNPKMYSLLDAECDEYFGFTDVEVRRMLKYYGLSEYYDTTKEWYDGYRIANAYVYNPWDVINWCNQLNTNPDKKPKSYWKNSSGNEEVKKFIRRMGNGVTKAQIERLVSGETVQKTIEEQLTYNTMYDNVENMWSLLFATGYLTPSEMPDGNLVRLKIPNNEVRDIFSNFILELFEEKVAEDGSLVTEFCNALKSGDTADVERVFTKGMGKTISIRDTAVRKEFKENFYHGLILGITLFKSDWGITSNRESGDGRYEKKIASHNAPESNDSVVDLSVPSTQASSPSDKSYYDIQIEIEEEEIGIVIEVKYAEGGDLDAACAEALDQINKNNYTAELKEDDMHKILKYGIACYKKQCKVVLERESF